MIQSTHAKPNRSLRSSQENFNDNWHYMDTLLMLQNTYIKASFEKKQEYVPI